MIQIRKVAVLGAGRMGHGIAQVFAHKGLDVSLVDLSAELLEKALAQIASNLSTLVDAGIITAAEVEQTLARIALSTDLASAVSEVDLVLEAAPEDLELKRGLFGQVDRHAPEHAILASNTSMLSISDFGSQVADPGRLIITHWFNPPHIVPVVEVVMGENTRDETRRTVFAFLETVGKRPVLVRKEIPGFLVNRIQTAMFREVMSLLEQGVASAEDIDRAVMGSFGLRLSVQGVLRTMDLAGLDLMLKACAYLFPKIESGLAPPQVLADKVSAGDLGDKTGRGFFDYGDQAGSPGDSPAQARDRALLAVLTAISRY